MTGVCVESVAGSIDATTSIVQRLDRIDALDAVNPSVAPANYIIGRASALWTMDCFMLMNDSVIPPERRMFCSRLVLVNLIGFALACSGGNDAGSGSKGNDAPGMSAASAADLPDPCSLITDQELSDFLFRSMEADQRPAMQARNAQYVFTKRVENVDAPAGRTCYFQYRLVAADTTWREGDFRLRTLARQTFEILAQAKPSSQDPIPGVGDQAFVFQNNVYARRGDVGVEVADFSSRNIVIEFLRLVVGRLP